MLTGTRKVYSCSPVSGAYQKVKLRCPTRFTSPTGTMNPGLPAAGAGAGSAAFVKNGTGSSSCTAPAGAGDATGATAPGNPGGLMMIWTQPPRRMQMPRRRTAQSPVHFMTSVFSFRRI